MEFILQVGLLAAMIAYLWRRHVDLNQRNRESGEDLLARVNAEMGTSNLNDGATWLSAQAIERDGDKMPNWRELWKLYQRAGLLLRLADFADRDHSPEAKHFDVNMMIALRRDAMQVRISALTAMAGSAFAR